MDWSARVILFAGGCLLYMLVISVFFTPWGLMLPLEWGLRSPPEYPFGGAMGDQIAVSEYVWRLLLGVVAIAGLVLYVPWSYGYSQGRGRATVAALTAVTICALFLVLKLPEPLEIDMHSAARLLAGNPEGAIAPEAIKMDPLRVDLGPAVPRQIPGYLTENVYLETGYVWDNLDGDRPWFFPLGTEHYWTGWYAFFNDLPEGAYRRQVGIKIFKVATQEQAAIGSACQADWGWAGLLDKSECQVELISGVAGSLLTTSTTRGWSVLFFMYGVEESIVHISVHNGSVPEDSELPPSARRQDLRLALETVVRLMPQQS